MSISRDYYHQIHDDFSGQLLRQFLRQESLWPCLAYLEITGRRELASCCYNPAKASFPGPPSLWSFLNYHSQRQIRDG
jgi:hypothetical protein